MEEAQPHERDDLPPTAEGSSEGVGTQGAPLTRQDSGQPLYLPLIDGHIIRLIVLQPGEPDDQIQLRLIVAELEFAPEYEAMSYVWGDPKDTTRIFCNGRELDITVNLHAALVQLRYTDRRRILWADAVCINQGHLRERSHHVAFMNIIYRHAAKVMICFGKDSDGGAKDVVALIQEHNLHRAEYDSVNEMSVLQPDDPIYDDPRWKSLAVVMRLPWFTRAWVLQEAGVAKDPRVLYGDMEFGYRDLIKLVRWVVRCAPNLQTRVGFHFLTIHMDWEDWSPDWQSKAGDTNYTLLDFLSHARGLFCKEPKDHVYAFIGHPLAQLENDGGPFLKPDYTKATPEVFLELSSFLLGKYGFRALSLVEHDESTVVEDFPSWVLRWDVEMVQNSFGVYTGFYYRASAGLDVESPITIEERKLKLQAILVDVVSKNYKFSVTSEDLETPEHLRALKPSDHKQVSLDQIWLDLNVNETPRIYADDEWLDAFSLTLCGGLMDYQCAQDNLQRQRANFAAYWKLRLQSTSTGQIPAELEVIGDQGDEERFWIDMDLCSQGRSFLITQKGYYALGPWVAEPGDKCFIFMGCRVPFILRETDGPSHYKLIGEAYIHGIMRGELVEPQVKQGMQEETIFIC